MCRPPITCKLQVAKRPADKTHRSYRLIVEQAAGSFEIVWQSSRLAFIWNEPYLECISGGCQFANCVQWKCTGQFEPASRAISLGALPFCVLRTGPLVAPQHLAIRHLTTGHSRLESPIKNSERTSQKKNMTFLLSRLNERT